MHQALKSCNIVQMEELLMKDNSEVNVPDPQRGWSPLYKAVLYRDLKIVKLLLLNGADPNLPSTVITKTKKKEKEEKKEEKEEEEKEEEK